MFYYDAQNIFYSTKITMENKLFLLILCSFCCLTSTYGQQCTGDPFMACFDTQVFVKVGEISMNLTNLVLHSSNEELHSANFRQKVHDLSEDMCQTTSTLNRCLAERGYTACLQRVSTDEDAAMALRFFRSYRFIFYGCKSWYLGGSEIQPTCGQSVDSYYDQCVDDLHQIPLIRRSYEFFTRLSMAAGTDYNMTTLPKISKANCIAWKSRIGCAVSKLTEAGCSTEAQAFSFVAANSQLELSGTLASDCSFGANETQQSIASYFEKRTTVGDVLWWMTTVSTSPVTTTFDENNVEDIDDEKAGLQRRYTRRRRPVQRNNGNQTTLQIAIQMFSVFFLVYFYLR